ncbi:hypothetical protein EKK58_01680 [Candidatus Dependentiae bacterium]|nr:MAG: hypothetical protein EKK58_01680 [Candidatus Dependentiae bacterium]
MLQDEFGIYDIYTFIHVPFWRTVFFKRFFFFSAILFVFFLIWQCLQLFFSRAKTKDVPVKLTVLTLLDEIRKEQNISLVYTKLSFILRLFFTDAHETDMISLTEHEIIRHIDTCKWCIENNKINVGDHCGICKANSLSLYHWEKEIKNILEKISSIKYEAGQLLSKETVVNDINMVTILVHSVYFKK